MSKYLKECLHSLLNNKYFVRPWFLVNCEYSFEQDRNLDVATWGFIQLLLKTVSEFVLISPCAYDLRSRHFLTVIMLAFLFPVKMEQFYFHVKRYSMQWIVSTAIFVFSFSCSRPIPSRHTRMSLYIPGMNWHQFHSNVGLVNMQTLGKILTTPPHIFFIPLVL